MNARLVVAVAAVAWLAGCASGPRVYTQFDQAADWSRYRTFGFVEPLGTDRAGYQTIVSQHLKEAARREMNARGFRYAEQDPDLVLNFNAELSEKVRSASTGPVFGAGYYGYRRGLYGAWPMYPAEPLITTYREGTLNVDLVDRVRRQMVWEGVAVDTVTDRTLENLGAGIDAAVAAVFAKLPVGARAAPAAP